MVMESNLSKFHLYSSPLQTSKTFVDIPAGIYLVIIKKTLEPFQHKNPWL